MPNDPAQPLDSPLSPSIIDNSPDSLPDEGDDLSVEEKDRLISKLRNEKAILQDERDAAHSEITVSSQKARLLIPFSNKVFWFVVWYCIVAGWIIMLDGDQRSDFELPDGVLMLLAGSTMASIIGLLASILTGIFKSD